MKKSKLSLACLILGIILIIVGILYITINKDSNNNSDKKNKDTVEKTGGSTNGITLEKEQCYNNICINNISFIQWSNQIQGLGFYIINRGSSDIVVNDIIFTLYDKNNKVIDVLNLDFDKTYKKNEEQEYYAQFADKNFDNIARYTFIYK